MQHLLIIAEFVIAFRRQTLSHRLLVFYPRVSSFLRRIWGQTDFGCSSLSNVRVVKEYVCVSWAALNVNDRLGRGGGFYIVPLDLQQTLPRSACTLAAQRHAAGGANVALSHHHSSASGSYLYLEATRCPCEPSARDHVLVAQTGIIVGANVICSNIVPLSKCCPH